MRSWLVVLVLGGCWTSSSPEPAHPVTETAPPPGPVRQSRPPLSDTDRAILAMTGFADQMCVCRDKVCADRVQDEMNRWSSEMARQSTGDKAAKLDDEQVKRMTEVVEKYGKCMMNAMGMGGSGGNPCAGP